MKGLLVTLRDSLRGRIRDESGVALVLVILVMGVFTVATSSVIYYTSTTARASARGNADTSAYSYAEAGVNAALAVIYKAADPRVATLLPSTTLTFTGGAATYS